MSSVSFFRFLLRFFQFFVGVGPGGDDDMLEASAPVAGLPAYSAAAEAVSRSGFTRTYVVTTTLTVH
jgi:hypothetical protein